MRILYHHRTRSKDGQYVHIEEMINALRSLGHEVIIVAPPSAETESFGSDAGAVAMLKRYLPKWFYEIMELGYALVAYRRLAQAVKQHRPDVLYERYNLFLPAGIWLKRKYKLPMLLEINAPILEERAKYDGLSLRRLARWSQAYAWRHADMVLPVTKVLGDMVQAYGVPAERIVVIPNGINGDRFDGNVDVLAAKQALGLEGQLVLGFTGFVRDWHGLDKVIDLIANDPPEALRTLLVVGDGPARAGLEQQAARLGVARRVHFTGIVERDNVAAYVAAFDIALQPAVVAYASPLKLFEYLALGKAVVAPDQPNIKEILQHEYNAILFDATDSNELALAVSRLCDDAELRSNIAINARASIIGQQLTWRENAIKVCKLFSELVHRA